MPITIDHHELVDEIQQALADDTTPQDVVERLAKDDIAACSEANRRLRECEGLLRRGLRGEAIQRGEVEPNLIDVVRILDFPDRAAWRERLRQAGCTLPPEMRITAASELNEAYALQQPLAADMARHRVLALARAPLSERIAILRKITLGDPENPIWHDDLRNYETARHKQLRGELEAAVRAADLDRLERLESELRQPGWFEPPHQAIVEWATEAARGLRAARARQQLQKVLPDLIAAFAELDVARARAARTHWEILLAVAQLAASDQLLDLAQPPLEWLSNLERRERARAEYDQAIVELQDALCRGADRKSLESAYHNLLRCEQGAPEPLETDVRTRLAEWELAAGRRRKWIAAATVAGTMVAACLAMYGIRSHFRAQKVDAVVKAVTKLIEAEKLDEAKERLHELQGDRSWIKDETQVVRLANRLHGLIDTENKRRGAFDDALSTASGAGVDPDARDLIDKARHLARTDAEKNHVDEIELRFTDELRKLTDQRNRKFRVQLAGVAERVGRTETGGTARSDLEDIIGELERDTDDLQRESQDVDSTLAAEASRLKKRVEILRATSRLHERRKNQLDKIVSAVGKRDDFRAFRSGLKGYASECGGDERAGDFAQVDENESSAWERLARWDDFISRFARLDLPDVRRGDAAPFAAEAREQLAVFPKAPEATELRRCIEFLETVARRTSSDDARLEKLKKIFTFDTIKDLWLVKDTDDNRYYTRERPEPNGKLVTFKYIVRSQGPPRQIALRKAMLPGDWIVRAPQSVAAEKILAQLRNVNDQNWEECFCAMLAAVDEETDMDPILKVQLLLQLLNVGSAGSLPMKEAFAKYHEVLSDANFEDLNWPDPRENDEVQRARKQANDLLSLLTSLKDRRDATLRALKALRDRSPAKYHRWIGCLLRSEDGNWRRDFPSVTEDETGELVVVVPETDGGTFETKKVGAIMNGEITLEQGSTSHREGRPIFLVIDAESKR